jgi:hypothetical protein
MSIESPQTRQEIIDAFAQQQSASIAYWEAFDTATFFRSIGSSWSPADTVRHLSKSIRPVGKALGTSKLVLRFLFGKAGRGSLTYDELRTRYLGLLAEGAQAGRFAPSPRSEEDPESWRAGIMRDFTRVNDDLRKAIARWPEAKLDRLQLPHPLLGKLTVREMLFFTLYHQRHHIEVVQRHFREIAR